MSTVAVGDLPLAGKVAVVTGASRGIGRAIAVRLARAGAQVVGCRVREPGGDRGFLDDLDAATAERCRLEICDVSDRSAVDRLAGRVVAQIGAPHVLVNNAGIVVRGRVEDTKDEDWQRVLDVNLTGTFFVTRAFLPAMKAAGDGRIIQIASIGGREGTALLSAYCAAKHGVVGFTRALARELAETRITCNAVCPGSVDTDMLPVGMPGGTPHMSPADVADVVFFLATGAPRALDGACIDVFG